MPSATLISPRKNQVARALSSALEAANKGARTRLVPAHEVADWPARVAKAPEGLLSADGGSVCNSYKYAAETTTASVSWWTSGAGKKTVVVRAGRTRANSTGWGNGPGVSGPRGSAWAATFPDRAARLGRRRRERLARLLDRVGAPGDDDRIAIRSESDRHLAAASGEGLLVADHPVRPRVVQVVVRDATTGQRHHITVPPKFATPSSKAYRDLGSSAARVHAAIAWTFDLAPSQYRPTVEA